MKSEGNEYIAFQPAADLGCGDNPVAARKFDNGTIVCLALFIASVIEPMVRRGTWRLLPFS